MKIAQSVCPGCNEMFEYTFQRGRKPTWCPKPACKTKRNRIYNRSPSGVLRNKCGQLKFKYGITLEQRNSILTAQGECCAVCNRTDPGSTKDWNVDHDHNTGKIRGILCHDCNLLLGHAKDDVSILQRAINYLK